MGLVAYRDIGDDYVTKKFDLTTDIQDLYANLLRAEGAWRRRLAGKRQRGARCRRQQAAMDAGGDVRRIVFLVGDAPPHMDYAQDTKYPVTLAVAKQKDIIVNAVLAGDARDTERVWRDIAQNGNGRFIPIPQDGGQVVIIETPYDEDIIILQKRDQRHGDPLWAARAAEAHRRQDPAIVAGRAAAPSQASEMASYINKRAKVSSEAVTGDGDLVATSRRAAADSPPSRTTNCRTICGR